MNENLNEKINKAIEHLLNDIKAHAVSAGNQMQMSQAVLNLANAKKAMR